MNGAVFSEYQTHRPIWKKLLRETDACTEYDSICVYGEREGNIQMKKLKILMVLAVLTAAVLLLGSCTNTNQPGAETGDKSGATEESSGEVTEPVTEADPKAAWEEGGPGVYEGEKEGIDFVLNVESGKDIQILQLTDPQITNWKTARNQTRRDQIRGAFFGDGITDVETKTYRYIREAIENSSPDLIVITGDLIYGETDDSGEIWNDLVAHMDSYGIPWALTFGNHDNESAKGVNWQIEQLMNSKYCVFKRGNVTGNCNYNIVIRQDGEIKYVMYMLDSNGCKEIANPGEGIMKDNVDIKLIQQKAGIYDDQIAWFKNCASLIAKEAGKEQVPSLAFYHIAPIQVYRVYEELYGYTRNRKLVLNHDGDYGLIMEFYKEDAIDRDEKFFAAAKEIGTTGMFFGHDHDNNGSMMFEGIRLTFGSKCGTHSYSTKRQIGYTQITIAESDSAMTVEAHRTKYQ